MRKTMSKAVASAERLDGRFIRTPMNYVHGELASDFEAVNPVSLTVPDQTLTVREQLKRFRGGTINGLAGEFMERDEDAPDFSKMDNIEIIQWREQAVAESEAIAERFREASRVLADKDEEARIEAEVQKRILLASQSVPPKPEEA